MNYRISFYRGSKQDQQNGTCRAYHYDTWFGSFQEMIHWVESYRNANPNVRSIVISCYES